MKTRAKTKPRQTCAGIAARAAGRRAVLDALVAEMFAYYQTGRSLAQVGIRYRRHPSAVRSLFTCRGLTLRPTPFRLPPRDPRTGHPLRVTPQTPEQIEQMIQSAPRLRVPAPLKVEWRSWSLDRRADFIRRLRARLADPTDRPGGPFSPNVVPFDYGTPEAHAIVAALNRGRDSRGAVSKIDICSQGVIYRGELWFWSRKSAGYFCGHWTPDARRPSLHRVIWERHHGRPIPASHVISVADGNRNNLDPANLVLRSRNDVARVNQARALERKSRAHVQLLLKRAATGGADTLLQLRARHHARD